jgi:shikimate kinase
LSAKASALAHGAATIVNAIALGQGAAFGVDLWTRAEVQLTEEPSVIRGEIASDPSESTLLMEKTVERAFRYFGIDHFGANVKTYSTIPIARGLKSSSTAANAIALATVAALRKELDDLDIINLGVDAAFDAKVTVTGAFDDACASYFGGAVVTDNENRKLLQHLPLPEGFKVLFHVPTKKAYTGATDATKLKVVKPFVESAFEEAQKGNFWMALTTNGTIYSAALGYDNSVATDALTAGAVAAGLCGKGPAVTAVVEEERVEDVKAAWQRHEGEIIEAHFNSEKAKVVT